MTFDEAVIAAKKIYQLSPSAIRKSLVELGEEAFQRGSAWPTQEWLRHMLSCDIDNRSRDERIKGNSVTLQLGILIGLKMRDSSVCLTDAQWSYLVTLLNDDIELATHFTESSKPISTEEAEGILLAINSQLS